MKTRIVLLTSLSLLLAACGQSTPQVSPPAPVATTPAPTATPIGTPVATPVAGHPLTGGTGATYEVTFQGANGGQISASARSIGVGALALQNAQSTLQFEQVASETFVTGGTRHVRSTFKVTNKGTAALDGLVFLPVDTDDADSDPSNNGSSVPTVGTTPFNRVSYFDGSDASSKAAGITATGGKRFNASTGAVESDPNASAFLSNQDVSRLSATPPANLVIAGIKTYGWKVSESLAPNASANVTFAADLPADADSKNDPFRFSLVLTDAVAGPAQIHDIQGSTPSGDAASPLNGRALTVGGIVTADYQLSTQLKGFFIQAPDADADSDPTTSEGIFVLCDTACKDVNVGDSVQVSGTVTEFATTTNTVTEIASVTNVAVTGSNLTLPAPQTITLPVASLNDYERYEGMRVRVQGVVTENFKLGRGGVVKVADTKIPSYTQLNAPSVSGYAAYVAAIARRTLSVDDGSTAQNPVDVYGRNNQPLSASNTLRTGDSADVTGVLHYGFDYTGTPDTWRVESTPAGASFTGPARPPAPSVTGNVTVASANVLNFFTTLVTSNADADNGGAPCTADGTDSANSRGANDCFEYKRQLAKVVRNLAGLNADVIGLMEVQNNATIGTTGDSLKTLVDALNASLGSTVYAAVTHPNPGTDFIRVALIYKTASVTPIGAPLTDTDPANSRFPLAQVFQAAGGGKFAVVVNHLKSKGSGTGVDADNLDGQGASANKREAQIARLLDLIQNQIVVGRGVSDVISVGDYNAYDMEPSLQNFQKGLDGLAGTSDDLSPVFDSSVYSYQFDSQFGSLDHAFVTQSLKARQVNGEKWHDNSDEPLVLDYNKEFKTPAQVGTTAAPGTYFESTAYRSSDHDPLKVGFTLPTLGTLGVTPSGNSVAFVGQPYTLNTPTTGTPDTLDIAWGDGSSDLGLPGSTTSRAHTYSSTGTPTITVTAKRGTETASGTQNVTVNAPSIAVNTANASLSVNNSGSGTTATNGVTVTRTGYSGGVNLSTSVSGAGTQPTVSVTIQPGAGTSGSLSIDGTGAAVGSYTVTVTASGSGVNDASTTFTVNVSAPVANTLGKLVISQVYGGGGSTSTSPTPSYKVDYIELFNAGNTDVSLAGKSLQYGSSTGTTFSSVYALKSVVIRPGQYYLVSVSSSTGTGGAAYSGADLTGADDTTTALNMAASNGKVALVDGTTAVSTTASTAALIDFVGYGTANTYEGAAAAPALSTTASGQRKLNGCQDTNQNGADFTAGTPTPRNSSTTFNVCN